MLSSEEVAALVAKAFFITTIYHPSVRWVCELAAELPTMAQGQTTSRRDEKKGWKHTLKGRYWPNDR